jgi:hypothetical protein
MVSSSPLPVQERMSSSQQLLQTAQDFVHRCAALVPDIDVRLLSAPLLSAAVQEEGPDTSARCLLAAAAEQTCTRDNGADLVDALERWQGHAAREIHDHVTPSNATKLAALARSLSDATAALAAAQQLRPESGFGQGTVQLILLCKALSLPASEEHPANDDGAAAPEGAEGDATRRYKRCRKYMKQLEAAQLAALLRYALLQGPQPLRIEGVRLTAAHLPGTLRLQIAQDGVALLKHALSRRSAHTLSNHGQDAATPAQPLSPVMPACQHGVLHLWAGRNNCLLTPCVNTKALI